MSGSPGWFGLDPVAAITAAVGVLGIAIAWRAACANARQAREAERANALTQLELSKTTVQVHANTTDVGSILLRLDAMHQRIEALQREVDECHAARREEQKARQDLEELLIGERAVQRRLEGELHDLQDTVSWILREAHRVRQVSVIPAP